MAVVAQIIQDGAKNHIVKLTIAGANAAAQVVTEATVSGASGAGIRNFSIYKIEWSLTGAPATLSWDATADVVIADLSAGWGELEFTPTLPNNAGAGKTGNIQLDNAAGVTSGYIILHVKKV